MTLGVGTPFKFPKKAWRALPGSGLKSRGVPVPKSSVKLPTRSSRVGMVMYWGVLLTVV